jgi:hypothetical protein
VHYNNNPEIGVREVLLSRPFFSLDSRLAFGVEYETVDRRDDWYLDGAIAARNRNEADKMTVKATQKIGGRHTVLKAGMVYNYTDREISNRIVFNDGVSLFFPDDSLYHYIEPQLGFEDIRYLRTHRIKMHSRVEDITLVRGLYIKFGSAWDAGSGERLYDNFGIEGKYEFYFHSNLFSLYFSRQRAYRDGIDLRRQLYISSRYYNNHLSWYTPVVAFDYAMDRRRDGMKTLYLGESNGVRGYPKNFLSGEKRIRASLEHRFFSNLAILSNLIGAVQFVDLSQVWNRGEKLDLGDLYWSVGFGLRFGTERLANRESVRVDLAYAGRTRDWEISFGVGQYIN